MQAKAKQIVRYKQGDIIPGNAHFLCAEMTLEGSKTEGINSNSGRIIVTNSYIVINLYEIDIIEEVESDPKDPNKLSLKFNELF